MIALAVFVGIATGYGAVGFRKLIDLFQVLFYDHGAGAFPEGIAWMGLVLAPMVGGLLVGLLVHYFAKEAKGHGVPEVMEAMTLRGGRIRPPVVLVKSLASSICIGSGGSAGREGPIVQIGSALGSSVGQFLKLSDRRVRNLVMCGAAAGIAATFNTPIAGVFFALEVIAGEFSLRSFTPVVVASVLATVVGHHYLGNVPAFQVPAYALVDPWELVLYVVLGAACAVVGVVFIRTLHFSETFFDERIRIPAPLKPVLGGFFIGVAGLLFPQILGVGYGAIDAVLLGKVSLGVMAALVVMKIFATSMTLGSGGSGGVFAPSLFIGAMVGGAFGAAVHSLWPESTGNPAAYAMVGMAALFAGTGRAPISAIIILFEMTRDYQIMLPLMFAVAVSTSLSGWLFRESIYSIKLKSRGIDLHPKHQIERLGGITIGKAMKPVERLTTVSPDMSIEALGGLFRETFHHGFAVVDDTGRLVGVVTLKDFDTALRTRQTAGKTVRDICSKNLVTAFPDETLEDVLQCFGALDVGRIPVVSREDPKRLVGMLRWSDTVRSYSEVLLNMEYEPGTTLLRCDINEGDPAVGKTLRELALPQDYVVHYIQRSKHLLVPRGGTVVEKGDCLVILASGAVDEGLSRYLYNPPPPPPIPGE
ncbi:MAG: chloride channel protein [Pseudomonadota bacterium]